MSAGLKAKHLKQYHEIGRLFIKYGWSDIAAQMRSSDFLAESELPNIPDESGKPEQLAADLEQMGATFIKLGQVLSTRPDLMPPAYLKALARLQDEVEPFPFAIAEQIVVSELGARLSKAFSSFETEPLAAASLGQVHRAALRDGRQVVVKVQRPEVRARVAQDFEAIEDMVEFLEKHLRVARRYQIARVFEEFRKTLIQELDYQREAANLRTLRENLRDFDLLVVPAPITDYTTSRVLTMEYISGRKITELGPLARLEIDTTLLIDQLFHAYLKQVLVDGVFHADPHPGNVFLTDDHKLALIDLGMIGRTTPAMQEELIKLLMAISDGKGETAADIAIRMSTTTDEFKPDVFIRSVAQLVAEQQDNCLKDIAVGQALLNLSRDAAQSGLFVPTELTLLGKTLLQLDLIGRTLDPDFNPNEAIRRHVRQILELRVRKETTPNRIFASMLELKDFVAMLPGKLTRILDAVADAKFEVKVRPVELGDLIEGFQKIANRITAGLILAALIVGAALLMNVQTTFRIFGYPGLAMIFFLGAAAGGFWLLFTIFVHDRKTRKHQEKR